MTTPSPEAMQARAFADELRKWWSFDDGQQHTHSWHDRENFIERKLPELLAQAAAEATERACRAICPHCDEGLPITSEFEDRSYHRGDGWADMECHAHAIRRRSGGRHG